MLTFSPKPRLGLCLREQKKHTTKQRGKGSVIKIHLKFLRCVPPLTITPLVHVLQHPFLFGRFKGNAQTKAEPRYVPDFSFLEALDRVNL